MLATDARVEAAIALTFGLFVGNISPRIFLVVYGSLIGLIAVLVLSHAWLEPFGDDGAGVSERL